MCDWLLVPLWLACTALAAAICVQCCCCYLIWKLCCRRKASPNITKIPGIEIPRL